MTGPEHYREAEALLRKARRFAEGDLENPALAVALATIAVGHATLADAAATAMQAAVDGSEPGMSSMESSEWYRVAGVKPLRNGDDA